MQRSFIFRICLFLSITILVMCSSLVYSQQKTRVHIEQADMLRFEKKDGVNYQRLIGNVKLRQDSTLFFCDSAFLNNDDNNMEAFGRVYINYSDSVDLYGDYLFYNGNSRIAEMDGNVKLVDNQVTLTTDHLIYDRNSRVARYNTGGTIEDEENVLTSIKGHYYTDYDEFFFKDSVVLVNPDYVLKSDTLRYNTLTEIAYIFGPTNITGEQDSIYSENGWYDTKNGVARLVDEAFIQHQEQSLEADTIYYDQRQEYGEAHSNITLTDTVQDVVVTGEWSVFDRYKGESFITDSAVAIFIDVTDSLFLHSDTIKVLNDTLDRANQILAFNRVKFFRKDLQGSCDSLVYNINDSIIYLYDDPVLWSEGNQLTADSILIYVSHNHVDSLILFNSAFIISNDTLEFFNQIKGRTMTAYFIKNELKKIRVFGNAETLYFVREEDGTMIGINKSLSSFMNILLSDSKILSIGYLSQPDAVLHPEQEISDEEKRLNGFYWMDDRRPEKKEDIFLKQK